MIKENNITIFPPDFALYPLSKEVQQTKHFVENSLDPSLITDRIKKIANLFAIYQRNISLIGNKRETFLILSAEDDHNGAFKLDKPCIKNFIVISEHFRIQHIFIRSIEGIRTHIENLNTSKTACSGMIIRAHGCPSEMVLWKKNTLNCFNASQFLPNYESFLMRNFTIILDSCSTGKSFKDSLGLQQSLAKAISRAFIETRVFSATATICAKSTKLYFDPCSKRIEARFFTTKYKKNLTARHYRNLNPKISYGSPQEEECFKTKQAFFQYVTERKVSKKRERYIRHFLQNADLKISDIQDLLKESLDKADLFTIRAILIAVPFQYISEIINKMIRSTYNRKLFRWIIQYLPYREKADILFRITEGRHFPGEPLYRRSKALLIKDLIYQTGFSRQDLPYTQYAQVIELAKQFT